MIAWAPSRGPPTCECCPTPTPRGPPHPHPRSPLTPAPPNPLTPTPPDPSTPQARDQEWVKGNLALKNNLASREPVRVIRGKVGPRVAARGAARRGAGA
jgi:hypothetical protein